MEKKVSKPSEERTKREEKKATTNIYYNSGSRVPDVACVSSSSKVHSSKADWVEEGGRERCKVNRRDSSVDDEEQKIWTMDFAMNLVVGHFEIKTNLPRRRFKLAADPFWHFLPFPERLFSPNEEKPTEQWGLNKSSHFRLFIPILWKWMHVKRLRDRKYDR